MQNVYAAPTHWTYFNDKNFLDRNNIFFIMFIKSFIFMKVLTQHFQYHWFRFWLWCLLKVDGVNVLCLQSSGILYFLQVVWTLHCPMQRRTRLYLSFRQIRLSIFDLCTIFGIFDSKVGYCRSVNTVFGIFDLFFPVLCDIGFVDTTVSEF